MSKLIYIYIHFFFLKNSLYGMIVFSDVLQITPAHDQDDFKAGKRHSLEFIVIFTDDGKINDNGGAEFSGMPRFEARKAVKEALKKKV